MATERKRTVHSSGAGGGYDYSSLSAWEAGEEGDLVTLDEWRVAECYAFDDTTAVTISGWTTDATRYVKVIAATGARHAGVWDAAKYRMSISGAHAVALIEANCYFEGLQIQLAESGATARSAISVGATVADNIYVDGCLFRQDPSSSGTGSLNGCSNTAGADFVIRNCLFYDFRQGTGRGVTNNGTSNIYVYNCTAHNCDDGFRQGASGSTVARNCLANGCTDGFVGTFGAASNYNASDIASDAPGANSRNGASGTATFVNAAGDDFHLGAGDTNCKDMGEDLSGVTYGFSNDVDGATRSGSWDIGMDEITGGGGISIPVVMNYYKRKRAA